MLPELLPNEQIKDIQGYEGLYAITSFGRVWSYPKPITGAFAHTKKLKKGKWQKATDNGYGYKIVSLSKMGRKNYYIHKLVANAFISNKNKHKYVNHIDFDKSNNKVSNLEWCTQSHNVKHSMCNKTNNHSSKYRGVYKSLNSWGALIYHNKKRIYLGVFQSEEEAHKKCLEKAKELGINLRAKQMYKRN